MSRPSKNLKAKFSNCLVKRVKEEGCSLSLRNFPNSKFIIHITKAEKVSKFLRMQRQRKCDRIVVTPLSKRDIYVPIELKNNPKTAEEVTKQLQGGMDFIALYDKNIVDFFPVLAAKEMDKRESRLLQQQLITVGNKNQRINRRKCKDVLEWGDVIAGL